MLPLDPFRGRRFESVAWFRETGLQLIIPNSTFPYLLAVTTCCRWEPGHTGHPPWVEESRKKPNSMNAAPFCVDIWPKEISCLIATWKEGGQILFFSIQSSFSLLGMKVGVGERCMQESWSSSSTVLPRKLLMRDWNPSLYFLEHPESQRVVLLVALSLGLGTRDILQSPSRLHVTEMMIPPSTPPLSSTYMDLGPGRGKGGVLGYWW